MDKHLWLSLLRLLVVRSPLLNALLDRFMCLLLLDDVLRCRRLRDLLR